MSDENRDLAEMPLHERLDYWRTQVAALHAELSAAKAENERMRAQEGLAGALKRKLFLAEAENERLKGVIKEGLVFSGAWLDGNTTGWDSWNDRASRAVDGSSYWLTVEADRDALAERVKVLQDERDAAGKLAHGIEADATDLACDVNDLRALLSQWVDEFSGLAPAQLVADTRAAIGDEK